MYSCCTTIGFWCYDVDFEVIKDIFALVPVHLFLQFVQSVLLHLGPTLSVSVYVSGILSWNNCWIGCMCLREPFLVCSVQ